MRGRLWIHGDGEVRIGDRVFFDARDAPIELYAWAGAEIVIGDDSTIGGGTSMESTRSIAIGARARLGSFCKVMDNHFHPLVGDRNERPAPRPVVIEEDVVIGPYSIVLAGAHLARGTCVEPGSIVKRGKAPREPRVVPPPGGERPKKSAVIVRDGRPVDGRFLAREMLSAARLLATDPRAGYGRIARGIGVLRAAVLFRGCERGELVNAQGHVHVVADGTIRLGDRVQLAGGMIPTRLVCHRGGELSVGSRAFFNYGVSVEATRSIRIGERCMFGSMVRIRDTGEKGRGPVVIGDDVWVAHGAFVEPGVTIGAASVVAAGSVVRADVPPHSLAAGNPAVCTPLSPRA